MAKFIHCIVAVAAAGMGMSALATPPVFSEQSYSEAFQAAVDQHKLFIVDATAEWCAPCKMMDRDTWVAPKVEAWIKENAIAVQIDVDEQTDLSKELRIRAMPTVIVFREGKEFDRIVGYRKPGELLGWLEGAHNGRTHVEELAARAGDRVGADGKINIDERMELAAAFVESGKFDKATEEYAWLWENMVAYAPSMVGVRSSFMLGDIESLMEQHKPARTRFIKFRDDLESTLKAGEGGWDALDDWLSLNTALKDDERSLAWVDRIKGDEAGRKTLRRVGYRVVELLRRNERWKEYGTIIADPVQRARQDWTMRVSQLAGVKADRPEIAAQFEEHTKSSFRQEMAQLHASLVLADRTPEARQLLEALLQIDDTPEMRQAIVTQALELEGVYPELESLVPKDNLEQRARMRVLLKKGE